MNRHLGTLLQRNPHDILREKILRYNHHRETRRYNRHRAIRRRSSRRPVILRGTHRPATLRDIRHRSARCVEQEMNRSLAAIAAVSRWVAAY
jgi:hypothetical protein